MTVRALAFYLPQFHPIPENDTWWGKGFTEWANVVRAKSYFILHEQPHLPTELGFYDLRVAETREAQANLAREYGISGFCYHHYWFGGKRLLERPFEEVLASGKPDFPFCLCWANENWTRRWDGAENELLIAQDHSPEDDIAFIRDLIRAFRDDRYIKVDGRPLLLVYRPDILPTPKETTDRWRREVEAAGFPGLYLVGCETFTVYGKYTDPRTLGFDAAAEFPPHAIRSRPINHRYQFLERFDGTVFDYEEVVENSLSRPVPDFPLHRGLFPSWDNTPRRKSQGYVFMRSNPALYREWLEGCLDWTERHRSGDERIVFINAWNEWAEGCHLEPDHLNGRAFLEATREALQEHRYRARMRSVALPQQMDPELREEVGRAIEGLLGPLQEENRSLRRRLDHLLSPSLVNDTVYRTIENIPVPMYVAEVLKSETRPHKRLRKALLSLLRLFWRSVGRAR